ncbi:hypothetical protein AB0I77_03010 [Streptomyces sp. NPDC050619]
MNVGHQPFDWTRVMLDRRRKTVVACDACHDRIHTAQQPDHSRRDHGRAG